MTGEAEREGREERKRKEDGETEKNEEDTQPGKELNKWLYNGQDDNNTKTEEIEATLH